jgi:hypothetical protein
LKDEMVSPWKNFCKLKHKKKQGIQTQPAEGNREGEKALSQMGQAGANVDKCK